MLAIGIDPGLSGAVAAVDHTGLTGMQDIPIMARGGGFVKHQIDPAGLSRVLSELTSGRDRNEVMVFIELIGGMPNQGVSSMISIGMTVGIIDAVVILQRFPHRYVTAAVWKKYHGLKKPKGEKQEFAKEQARALALRLYPDADIIRKKDHNRAEAILIARYGHEVTA